MASRDPNSWKIGIYNKFDGKKFSWPVKHHSHVIEYYHFWFEIGTLLMTAPQKGRSCLSTKVTDKKYPSLNFWGVFMFVNVQQKSVVPNFQFLLEIPYAWQKGRWSHLTRAVFIDPSLITCKLLVLIIGTPFYINFPPILGSHPFYQDPHPPSIRPYIQVLNMYPVNS